VTLSNIDQLKLEAVLREIGDRRSKISHFAGYTVIAAVLATVAILDGAIALALLFAVPVGFWLLAIRSERRQLRALRADQSRLQAWIARID
jgi:TRAP-type C4-dicarboxylate transport system permease small subunit